MRFTQTDDVRIVIPRAALTAVFDECDRVDVDETGGRLVGTFVEDGKKLTVEVTGVIGPGARARRTPTSFFQDGEEQERIFRAIERHHPATEHLGNWHTHHVNGFPTLSAGDIDTYRRTVNHANHNTSFFYALLVVAKHVGRGADARYAVKHYVLRRQDDRVYEVPSGNVKYVDAKLTWPADRKDTVEPADTLEPGHIDRVYDRDILSEFYRGIRPYASPSLGVYWRGMLELVDGTDVEVLTVERQSASTVTYSFVLRKPPEHLASVAEELSRRQFPSARGALIEGERACNRALYQRLRSND